VLQRGGGFEKKWKTVLCLNSAGFRSFMAGDMVWGGGTLTNSVTRMLRLVKK
jgi:hypothetical protein